MLRHIDGAAFYQNETEVGEGIKEAIKESKGKIKRYVRYEYVQYTYSLHTSLHISVLYAGMISS